MIDTGRHHDIKELDNLLNRTSDVGRRHSIMESIKKISNESGLVRSMRESLIKAHRDGNVDEIKNIHNFIKGKEKYGQ